MVVVVVEVMRVGGVARLGRSPLHTAGVCVAQCQVTRGGSSTWRVLRAARGKAWHRYTPTLS